MPEVKCRLLANAESPPRRLIAHQLVVYRTAGNYWSMTINLEEVASLSQEVVSALDQSLNVVSVQRLRAGAAALRSS
jgi:hypothetical protein